MLTTIDHITLAARDFEPAIERYRVLLGCNPTQRHRDDGQALARFQLENTALDVVAMDTSGASEEGIASITLATADLSRTRHILERRGIQTQTFEDQYLLLASTATYGVRIQIMARQADPSMASARDSHKQDDITGLDHVVITTSHPERAAALYGARLGLEMKLDRTNPDWGSRLMFFKCGDSIIEIAHSLKKADPNLPDKAWGLSWRTGNIESANARLTQAGFNVSEVRTGRKPGTRVFTVRDAPGGVPTLVLGVEHAR